MNDEQILEKYLHDSLCAMAEAKIVFPKECKVSIYHHKGIHNIYHTGATFMNVVNRDYCKSYVIILPGQKYPNHYHRIKRESFYVLHGSLRVQIEDDNHILNEGEMLHVERGQEHSFWSDQGVIFEEISTMYVANDSVYTDESILKTSYTARRTIIQMDDWKGIREKWMK